jgi:cyanophycinase
VRVVVPDDGRPLTAGDTAGAAGVYVAGGLIPRYRALLVDDAEPGWLPTEVPYAGFSAGCAVAAERAIVGGWRHAGVEVCPQDAGEDVDELTTGAGLGVVPFALDVHATQWGTLGRLLHAVQAGLVPEGWAVDEHTCLEVSPGGGTSVHGWGTAYRVARAHVDVHVTPVRGRRAG